MRFFVGLHQPSDAKHFGAAFVSVGRLRKRKGPFKVADWIMDSQAFTTIRTHGGYPHAPEEYAEQIKRWKGNGNLLAAVTQDYMCEPIMLQKTGLTVADHQRLTIERYDRLIACDTGIYIMPVLQGYTPDEYVSHLRQYGERLQHGMWIGVGSICKRNSSPCLILDVLMAIKMERPDLRLHGFGLKLLLWRMAQSAPCLKALIRWHGALRRGVLAKGRMTGGTLSDSAKPLAVLRFIRLICLKCYGNDTMTMHLTQRGSYDNLKTP